MPKNVSDTSMELNIGVKFNFHENVITYFYFGYLDFTNNLGKFVGFFFTMAAVATPAFCSSFHLAHTKILKEQSDAKNRKES